MNDTANALVPGEADVAQPDANTKRITGFVKEGSRVTDCKQVDCQL